MQEGLEAWQMSDGPIDRSDPSDKAVYGRTIFYRWIYYSNLLRTKISLCSLELLKSEM